MTGRDRWRAYVSLALLVAALIVPFPLAMGMIATAGAARLAVGVRRRILVARGMRAAAAGRGRSVRLGQDLRGAAVTLSDQQLAAHALLVGASGAGKSTTMLTILAGHIREGRPVVAIDMKGSPGFARQLAAAAAGAGRELRIWTPDGPNQWNPLAHGNATALKDMLISTERFSEPHYQRAAERYLQTAFTVLHAIHPQRPAQLHEVVAVMEPPRLAARLREAPPGLAERVGDYLGGLTPDQESAVRGLGTRLALLSESSAGRYLAPGARADGHNVDLREALEGGDVVLMSLNSGVYGKLGAQLGALAIQALTSAAGYRLQADGQSGAAVPATVAIDEFSALGADNVLSLLARGRESGVTMLVATQELSDLERAGRGFRDQVMGIVGVTIAHRQDVHSSATMISQTAGTEWVWDVTQTLRGLFARPGAVRGTRRLVERPVLPANQIKSLGVGEAMLLTKLPTAHLTWVQVTPPFTPLHAAASEQRRPQPSRAAGIGAAVSRAPARALPADAATPRPPAAGPPTAGSASPGRREPPDQAAPGVTR
ncbi:MAG: TraM recognition domain-containing protein [Solirubrobacteraceae bacterium]